MRKKIVAGNWKMNQNLAEGQTLVNDIINGLPTLTDTKQVVICPPYLNIALTVAQTNNAAHISTGAQNCHEKASGAYTGEISAPMLAHLGVSYVIIGHSERREYFNESNEQLAQKVDVALSNNLQVIFCCGESLEIRDANEQNSFVEKQIKESLFHLGEEQMKNVVIAYEPIWAIGTGRTASSEQAQEIHAHIRSVLAGKYGETIANDTTILYGGSCKPSNANELFACPDVDGGLIGGAALKAEDFLGIINAMMAN
ncbi:MAG: triose-phosphate isomerase [Flavipsychrobacter sp.]